MKKIERVCVIGAGVMGSGIAAQIANSGCEVLLLDVAKTESADRSVIAKSAMEKMLITRPEPLSHASRLSFITPGNLEDDLAKIRDCQLIIEAIVEKLEIKQSLYNKLLPHLAEGAIIASNTSTIALKHLKEKLPEGFQKNFLILHFFNPPRYMSLLELISDDQTSEDVKNIASDFVIHNLGKDVVACADTPGFIANRIGCFLLELTVRKTMEYNLDIEVVDHIFSKYLSFPTTAIFGLYDLIGLDVMKLISSSLCNSLPADDKFVTIYSNLPQIDHMIETGYNSRKGLGGFYRINNTSGTKVKEVLSFNTMEYHTCASSDSNFGNINHLMAIDSNLGKAIKEIIIEFGQYVCSLYPDVTSNIYDIDKAMRIGYNWKYGPFELFHKVIDNGFEFIAKNSKSPSFFISEKLYSKIDDSKFSSKLNLIEDYFASEVVKTNYSSFIEFKNGDLCFSLKTKMNCLGEELFRDLMNALNYAEEREKKLYIYSDTPHFSAGADLQFVLENIVTQNWKRIDEFLILGQKVMQMIKYAKTPVIAVASGTSLGGGCELLLHSRNIVAHQQLSAGLVEVGVGLIPSFGGLKEMVIRGSKSQEKLLHNLKNILLQNKGTSADYFANDYDVDLHITMNRADILKEALSIKPNHHLVPVKEITLPEFDIMSNIDVKSLDDHSKHIAELMNSLSRKIVTEEYLLEFERECFLKLVKTSAAEAKIRKILA